LTQCPQTANIGLFTAATWAYPLLTNLAKENKSAHPSFLLTWAPLYNRPLSDRTSLSLNKAAQVNQMQSFKQMMEPQGVHVGGVNIAGVVADWHPIRNAKAIAQLIYDQSREDEKNWTWEVQNGDWDDFLQEVQDGKWSSR
jgi:hypothetical protein